MNVKLCDAEPRVITAEERTRHRNKVLNGFNNTDAKFLSNNDDAVYHGGYLGYLDTCWRRHFSAVLKPDDLWHIIMSEMAVEVRSDPKAYAHHFTSTPDQKQLIVVQTDDVEHIDPTLLVGKLKEKVPMTEEFLPEFSTTTHNARLARHVAFADVCSPYYSYGTKLCGIPNFRVDGTYEDWLRCIGHLERLSIAFGLKTQMGLYLQRCMNRAVLITRTVFDNGEEARKRLFEQIAKMERCGSGSQYEMWGWILEFLFKPTRKIQNDALPHHLARLNFTNLDTKRQFTLFAGCWSSNFKDGFLEPEFGLAHCEWVPRQVEKQEWTPGRYAKGATVVKHGWVYEAKQETDQEPCGDRNRDWRPVGEVPLKFTVISSPIQQPRGTVIIPNSKFVVEEQQDIQSFHGTSEEET